MSDSKIIEVVAGALMRPDGSFMLGDRPEGKPYAGYWEFPGGKVEPGESGEQALARELHEEMGIEMLAATPWLTKVHHYEHASVRLHFFRVWSWRGEPQSRKAKASPGRRRALARCSPCCRPTDPFSNRWNCRRLMRSLARTKSASMRSCAGWNRAGLGHGAGTRTADGARRAR